MLVLLKKTLQWLILVNTKMKFKVPFGQEQLSIYLLLHILSNKKLHVTSLSKDKDAIFAWLQKFYGNTTTFPEEHIYSDGPSVNSKIYTWCFYIMLPNKILLNSPGIILPLAMVKKWLMELVGKLKIWFDKFWVKTKMQLLKMQQIAWVCEEFKPNLCMHLMMQDDLIAAQKFNVGKFVESNRYFKNNMLKLKMESFQ